MKNLILFLFCFPLFAQTFHVQQLDEKFEIDSLDAPKGISVIKAETSKEKKLPATHLIFDVVNKYAPPHFADEWDALDYDQFYLRLKSWSTEEILERYKNINHKSINLMKKEIEKYE